MQEAGQQFIVKCGACCTPNIKTGQSFVSIEKLNLAHKYNDASSVEFTVHVLWLEVTRGRPETTSKPAKLSIISTTRSVKLTG